MVAALPKQSNGGGEPDGPPSPLHYQVSLLPTCTHLLWLWYGGRLLYRSFYVGRKTTTKIMPQSHTGYLRTSQPLWELHNYSFHGVSNLYKYWSVLLCSWWPLDTRWSVGTSSGWAGEGNSSASLRILCSASV